jgi:hypothetical protein
MKLLNMMLIIILSCISVYAVDYFAYKAETAPTIDGVIGYSEWANLTVDMVCPDILNAPNQGSVIIGSENGPLPSDASAQVYITWDASNLYIAIDVTDNNQNWRAYSPGPYNSQDAFQVCFNLNKVGTRYIGDDPASDTAIWDIVADTADAAGAGIYSHGRAFSNIEQIQIEAQTNASGYVIEAAIPWGQIDGDYLPAIGDEHGVGFMVLDFDNNALNALFTDFGEGENTIEQPSTWNTLRLISEDGCGLLSFSSGDVNNDCIVDLSDLSTLAVYWSKCTDPDDPECIDLR